jgi:sulfatase maturation enzyme AslB (radical SAM superfamily)
VKPVYVYLLKVTEFCNLNCPYCYMFNLKDSSPLRKPRVMPLDVVAAAAPKMAALAVEQGVKELTVCFHGGEPMLAGQTWFRQAVELLRSAAGQSVQLRFFLQSNGLSIDESWLDLCEALEIRVGLSMDGPRAVHDRVRVDHSGQGSYAAAVRGLELLQTRKDLFTGVLCVIDPTTDGLEIYQHFRELGIERMDFLWPLDYNWTLFQAALAGQNGLCEACRACPFHDVCGGGYLPHRYSTERGFSNPTVYCRDLWKLITHVLEAAVRELAAGEARRAIPRSAADRSAIAFGVQA